MTEDDSDVERRRLLIAGSGIAGLTAAIYAARSNNEPLVLEGTEPGGQLTLTTAVENYPGFPEGIGGTELIDRMREQAERFGATVENGVVEEVDHNARPFQVDLASGRTVLADAVIAASGASARTLGVPGEDELMGYGLSTCATCDGAFFRDDEVVVVGGGDAACEEATFLTKFASTVHLVHRRDEFRAEDYWVDRLLEHVDDGTVELHLNTELTALHGSREEGIDSVELVSHPDGHPTEKLEAGRADEVDRVDFDCDGVFYAIGHTPNTDYLGGTGVSLDDAGYVHAEGGTGGGQTETGVEGLFAAGDVVDHHYQQAITAGGMGCKAAMDADDYLDELDRQRARQVTGGATAAEGDD